MLENFSLEFKTFIICTFPRATLLHDPPISSGQLAAKSHLDGVYDSTLSAKCILDDGCSQHIFVVKFGSCVSWNIFFNFTEFPFL